MKKILYVIVIIFISFTTSCTHSNQNKVEESYEQETHTVGSGSESTTKQKEDNKEEITTGQLNSDVNIYMPNGRTPQLLLDVILEDKEFVWVEMKAGEEEGLASRPMRLSEYNYRGGLFYKEPVKLGSYRVVDLDGDGYNEVIVEVVPDEVIIFHYENDKVYGYVDNWRCLAKITTSGIVRGSSGASYCYDYRIQFEGETYTEKMLSLMDGDKYYINGELVVEDKYWEYVNELNNQEEVPYWNDYQLLDVTK